MTRTPTRARTIVAALAVTLAFVAAGCGSSGGSDSTDTTAAKGDAATTTAAASEAPVALEGKVNDKGTKDISGDGSAAKLDMELDDDYFSPTFIKAEPGAKVTIELENEGDNPHTFTLDDGSVDQQVEPGAKETVTITVPDDGSLRFSCDFHGSMGMQGAFYTGTGSSGGGATTTTAASSDSGGSGY
jgi:plastocyanin